MSTPQGKERDVMETTPAIDASDVQKQAVEHDELALAKGDVNLDLVDKEVAQYASAQPTEIDDATNRRLKKAIDKRILLTMVITYFLQSVDKSALSFASIMGIQEDTHLKGSQYSWLTTVIYLVILCLEYPENLIIQRVPIAKWLGFNVAAWGIVVAMTAVCHNFTGLIIARALLGAFECVCQPTFTLLSATWYRRDEQAATVVLWYAMNGIQQIIGGLVAFIFTKIPESIAIARWRALFITHGGIAFLWGLFILWWTPDSPMRAKCFSESDKRLIIERVRDNQTGLQNKKFRIEQVKEVFCDPQVYCFILIQLVTTLPSGGLGAYASIIIKSFGYDTWTVQLLQMVTGIVQVISMLTGVWIERKYKQTLWPSIASVIPTVAGAAVLCAIPANDGNKVGLLLAWYCMYSFWCAVGLALSLLTRNVAGQTKKALVIALNFIAWAVGNSIGPQVFRSQDAPRYFPAFATILVCFSLLVVILFALRTWYVWQNKIRDRMAMEAGLAPEDLRNAHSFEDITDRVNLNFRYQY